MPYWAHGGQELFYADPSSRTMISAKFERAPRFRVLTRESVFTLSPDIDGNSVALLYDVTADDQRFVMSRLDAAAGEAQQTTSRMCSSRTSSRSSSGWYRIRVGC